MACGKRLQQLSHYILFFVTLFLVACAAEPGTVEVTREVTRIVEVTVEVTRVIEVIATTAPETNERAQDCEQFKETMDSLIVRWDDTFQLASRTQRIMISSSIAELQQIRRDLMDVEESDCARSLMVKDKGIEMMDNGISIYTSFLEEHPTELEELMYTVALDVFTDAILALELGLEKAPTRAHFFSYMENDGHVHTLEYLYGNDIVNSLAFNRSEPLDSIEVDASTYALTTTILDGLEGGGAEITIEPKHRRLSEDIFCSILLNGEPVLEEKKRVPARFDFHCGITFDGLTAYSRDYP